MGWLSFLFLLHLSTKGFALNECDRCTCCKGGATRCQHYVATSDYCLDGCIGGFYSSRCVHACMNNCLNCSISQLCKKCSDGYFGAYCYNCPDNCLTCSNLSSCISCKDGFYNGRLYDSDSYPYYSDCRNKCQNNCKSCTSYNTCTECVEGKYDSNCDIQCPIGCENNLCKRNGDCYSCKAGFSGSTASKCDQCVNGKYGIHCDQDCLENYAGCSSSTNCSSCVAVYWGQTCQNLYSKGCNLSKCDQATGTCTTGCIQGYIEDNCDTCDHGFYGPSCQTCPDNCEDSISKTQCTVCKRGYWGEMCQLSCPSNCISSICRKLSGDCDLPCALGYWGAKCNYTCPTNCKVGSCNSTAGVCNDGCRKNYYGTQCNMTCATTCLPDDEGRKCFDSNGSCVKDCQNGYYGDVCQNRCSENCIINICSRTSSACKFGCVSGCEGKNCTKSNSGLMADTGNKADSSNIGVIIGACVGSAAGTLLAVGIVIIIRRCLRHRQLGRHTPERTHELTDVQQENVRAVPEPPNIERAADSGYVNTPFPVYEQLKASNKNSNIYDRIEGTNVS